MITFSHTYCTGAGFEFRSGHLGSSVEVIVSHAFYPSLLMLFHIP